MNGIKLHYMFKQAAKKILPEKAYRLIKRIVRPSKINYYLISEINKKIRQSGLKKIAILIDGQTEVEPLFTTLEAEIVGIYSFNLDIIDQKMGKFDIKPLLPNVKIETGGWIVSSLNETASFSLSRFLLASKRENQIIFQHLKLQNTTKYYSYADFFHNEQKTIIHLNNYFRRCYALSFPLNLILTLRDLEGKIVKTSQIILPPDGGKVIKSEDFKVENFAGYLEVEFEIGKKVTPFLHYMVDYISKDFISSNHQSGLGLHPAHSAFTRGYIPVEKNKSLVICLFQHNYEEPVNIPAILRYTSENGEKKTETKLLPPLGKKKMLYQDVKKLFEEIDFSKVRSPYITIDSPVPLHRPNYYYTMKDKAGYYDTSHAGPDLSNQVRLVYGGSPATASAEKNKMDEYGVATMDLRHHLLPKEMNVDSIISLGNDTTCEIKDFRLDIFDKQGKLVESFEDSFDFETERYWNVSTYLEKKGLHDFCGTISFKPGKKAAAVPVSANSITGFLNKRNGALTSTAGNGSAPDNIPFYWRGGPPNYIKAKCSAGTTDIFARGVASADFDTLFMISYQTADQNLKNEARYEIQIINTRGEKKTLYRMISPNGFDLLKLHDMVNETGHESEGGFYTVWLFSADAHLYAQHIQKRESDGAIALEHMYPGKFGL